jgi:hypothetical protein
MEGNNNVHQGAFLSRGGDGYTAPSLPQSSIETVIQHMRQCRSELTRNMIVLQQAALEQERTEQRFEGLAEVVTLLIEVARKPAVGSVVAKDWITERDQVIAVLHEMLEEARQKEAREKGKSSSLGNDF